MATSKDILITGAGPAGLSMAIFLSELGYVPRIIDKKKKIDSFSKALAVNPRTLEIFEPLGITERFLTNGKKMEAINIFRGSQHVFRNDFSKVKHKFPFMLIQPQKESEEILLDEVQKRKIKVEYDTTLESFSATNTKVHSRINSFHGMSEGTSDLIIGADGGGSTVRQQANIQYKGFRYEEDWEILDIALETNLHPDEGHIILHPEGGMIMIPFHNGIWRLAGSLENLTQYLPKGTEVSEIIWASKFKIHHKVAKTLTGERVAIIGDAAHLHSPVGARGMNLGIEDGYVLSQLIHKGKMGEFSRARLPYLNKTVNRINNITMALAGEGRRPRMIRKNIQLMSMFFPFIMPTVRKFIMGLNQ